MVKVRRSREGDVKSLCKRLRSADRIELRVSKGPLIRKALERGVMNSERCFSIDDSGRVIGMFGVTPYRIEGRLRVGAPWMVGSDELFNLYTRRFLREYPIWLERLCEGYDVLENFVYSGNEKHIRWLKFAGFELVELVECYGVGREPFWRFRIDLRSSGVLGPRHRRKVIA